MKIKIILLGLYLLSFHRICAASLVVDWASFVTLRSYSGAPLSNGGTGAGDGTLIELGHYSLATASSPFIGTWMVLGTTTMGDDGARFQGTFTTSTTLASGTFTAPSIGTPLAIRYYDGTTVANSNYFNSVSKDDGSWNWIAPNDSQARLILTFGKASDVTLQSRALPPGTGFSFDSQTVILIPELSTPFLLSKAALLGYLQKRRGKL